MHGALLHLSTWAVLLSVACGAARARRAWAHVALLHVLCMTVVVFSAPPCGDATKWAWLVAKALVFAWARARCAPVRASWWHAPLPLAAAALYVSCADVPALYGCAPPWWTYAGALLGALVVHAGRVAYS